MLELVREVRPLLEVIARKDPKLGDQMRRAVQSVVLNTAEGMGSQGLNRRARYHTALGSVREAWACVEIGVLLGYVAPPAAELANRFAHVTGTLVKLAA